MAQKIMIKISGRNNNFVDERAELETAEAISKEERNP